MEEDSSSEWMNELKSMKPIHSLSLIVLAGVAGFLLGNRGDSAAALPENADAARNPRSGSTRAVSSAAERTSSSTRLRPGRQLTAERAAKLNSSERIALLKKAALLGDPGRQEDVLCGLVSVMTREELALAVETLRQAMGRGNPWSQEVWDTVWSQWGKVDPHACLELAAKGGALFTSNDCRRFMMGWLEVDPEGALRWAREPGKDGRGEAAAAYAIMQSAGGDLDKMQAAMTSISGDAGVVNSCLHDFFDLAISTDATKTPAVLYDTMTPELQAKSWSVVLSRLAYTDPAQAATWLEHHAADPGAQYQWNRMYAEMAMKDPARMVEWACRLPTVSKSGAPIPGVHPVQMALSQWRQSDPEAAAAWIQSRPANDPWAGRFRN